MSLFDEEGKDKRTKSLGDKKKLPETPDMKEWGAPPRKGSPFALDNFSSSSVSNITKP